LQPSGHRQPGAAELDDYHAQRVLDQRADLRSLARLRCRALLPAAKALSKLLEQAGSVICGWRHRQIGSGELRLAGLIDQVGRCVRDLTDFELPIGNPLLSLYSPPR